MSETESGTRRAQRKRWRRDALRHLEDFPRQYAALESAMAAFGGDFRLAEFKRAFTTADDMEAYNRVQAVERAMGRVQNYLAELAAAGMKLAELPRPPMQAGGSEAQQSFEALRDAGIIDANLCRRLTRAQNARSRIEHGYVDVPAGDVHRAVQLVHDAALDFIARFRKWIAPYLQEEGI